MGWRRFSRWRREEEGREEKKHQYTKSGARCITPTQHTNSHHIIIDSHTHTQTKNPNPNLHYYHWRAKLEQRLYDFLLRLSPQLYFLPLVLLGSRAETSSIAGFYTCILNRWFFPCVCRRLAVSGLSVRSLQGAQPGSVEFACSHPSTGAGCWRILFAWSRLVVPSRLFSVRLKVGIHTPRIPLFACCSVLFWCSSFGLFPESHFERWRDVYSFTSSLVDGWYFVSRFFALQKMSVVLDIFNVFRTASYFEMQSLLASDSI